MSEGLMLDYYYGNEPDRLCFYRIPKVLFTKACFSGISTDAMVLYGLLLDQMSLSMENGWRDKENRVFIMYSVQRVCAYLGCKKDKALKLLAELDTETGIGLIERVKRGQGKSDIIYVKNFEVAADAEDREEIKKLRKSNDYGTDNETEGIEIEVVGKTDQSEKPTTSDEIKVVGKTDRSEKSTTLDEKKPVGKTDQSEKPTTLDKKKPVGKIDQSEKPTTLDEKKPVGKIDRSEKPTSRGRENRLLEVGKTDPNYNDYNYTDFSKNEMNDINLINPINLSYGKRESLMDKIERIDRMDKKNQIQAYMDLIRSNIEYDYYSKYGDYTTKTLYDDIYRIMCDVVCYRTGIIKVGKGYYPQEKVKSVFLQIDSDHVLYVIECLNNTKSEITRMDEYLIVALYRSYMTMDTYYQQRVQHDLYGGGSCYS